MKCLSCQKETKKWGHSFVKYCNIQCKLEYEKKINKNHYDNIDCINCGKNFIPKSKVNKFCSRECKNTIQAKNKSKKPDLKKCKFCKNEFKPYTSLDKFCSANCRVNEVKSKRSRNWQSVENITGAKNTSYKHGLRTSNETRKKILTKQSEYSRIRINKIQNMFESHGYLFCEKCNISNVKLETHHIIFRSEKPNHEHIHNERNLITLCVKCHNYFHKDKKVRNYLIGDRNLEELFGNDILR
jgi:hypothetical protein